MIILFWPTVGSLTAALLSILAICFDLSAPRRPSRVNRSTGTVVRIIALTANALLMLGLGLWGIFIMLR